MRDIVERLEAHAAAVSGTAAEMAFLNARDEIVRLRAQTWDYYERISEIAAERDRLREALKFYRCDCDACCEVGDEDSPSCGSRARAALGDTQ